MADQTSYDIEAAWDRANEHSKSIYERGGLLRMGGKGYRRIRIFTDDPSVPNLGVDIDAVDDRGNHVSLRGYKLNYLDVYVTDN